MDHHEAVETLASERYLLGEMSEAERDAFEEHFFSCLECADDVMGGSRMRDGVRRGLASAEVVPMRRAWRPAIAIPWAAAATLAILAGYESVHTRPAGLTMDAPIALAPATLRPATRGEEPSVKPGPGELVTLAVDVPAGAAGSTIHYTLRRSDGAAVASGDVAAPEAGAPLLLMMNSRLFNSGDHYLLVTQNPGNPGLTGEEYRFRVESR
jgi:anti-sigma factor RsiW